jgi:hypothetical protein
MKKEFETIIDRAMENSIRLGKFLEQSKFDDKYFLRAFPKLKLKYKRIKAKLGIRDFAFKCFAILKRIGK